MKKIAFFVLAMGLAVPAFAGDDAAKKPKKEKKEPKICKTVDASHSRMGNRVCKTAAQWAATAGQNGKAMEDLKGATN